MEVPVRYHDGMFEEVNSFEYIENSEENDYIMDWNGQQITADEFSNIIDGLIDRAQDGQVYGANGAVTNAGTFNQMTSSLGGIFGMPYQFSEIVDPIISTYGAADGYKIGRKFTEKIFSVMPVLFLTPGEPKFMEGYSAKAKRNMASKLASVLGGDDGEGYEFDEGRYYSFVSNFPAYEKYANTALRALALYMGIGDVEIPIPGSTTLMPLKKIEIRHFMNNDFTKLFGTNATVPFFIDAQTSISESFSNGTTEPAVSQTVNGLSQNAREIQFIMGGGNKSLVNNLAKSLSELGTNAMSALGDLSEVLAGKSILSRLTNELTTVVAGGKIVFPEIWSDSGYSRDISIDIKLRSPDPDPISIYLNIYMPIILLISMAAPRQIGNSSNSYESPFLVRATYKSIFSCDLGIIESLSISKGDTGSWNVMGQPITANVSIGIKDLYSNMMISKRMGLISNTAQMDYLANMAGVDLNEYEPLRMVKLWGNIISNTPRDWTHDFWGGFTRKLSLGTTRLLSKFSDTRFLT